MKLLILDKDGTLVEPKAGSSFVQSPEDQKLLPGVADALDRYETDGWSLAIATNQGGVAAGHKTLESAVQEVQFAMTLTGINMAIMAHSYENNGGEAVFLNGGQWHLITDQKRRFRKPGGGMIDYLCPNRRGSNVIFVGDRDEDMKAAKSANVEFLWADQWRANAK